MGHHEKVYSLKYEIIREDRSQKEVSIKIEEDLDEYHVMDAFKELILDLVNEGFRKIILDFDEVNFIDEKAMSRFLVVCKRLHRKEGALLVKNIQEQTESTLEPLCSLDLLEEK